MVSCKIPILATRVRFPGSATFLPQHIHLFTSFLVNNASICQLCLIFFITNQWLYSSISLLLQFISMAVGLGGINPPVTDEFSSQKSSNTEKNSWQGALMPGMIKRKLLVPHLPRFSGGYLKSHMHKIIPAIGMRVKSEHTLNHEQNRNTQICFQATASEIVVRKMLANSAPVRW